MIHLKHIKIRTIFNKIFNKIICWININLFGSIHSGDWSVPYEGFRIVHCINCGKELGWVNSKGERRQKKGIRTNINFYSK